MGTQMMMQGKSLTIKKSVIEGMADLVNPPKYRNGHGVRARGGGERMMQGKSLTFKHDE